MNRYVCIHGHFYQPPRENPWLEAVEPQDSAYPYHDWNERVTAESYAPNTASRILDEQQRILDIVNNYTQISFNFGPTLLSWMQQHAPDVYESILKADRQSQATFSGHGLAIAQAYSHMIMPLANFRDERTQVLWGTRDFEFHFQRRPEGMWLPETAVNTETLEILAEAGVLFTILAPRQARQVKKLDEKKWHDVSDGSVDTQRPYLCRLPSGKTITLFFYDGFVSQEIAFGELLKNGENFAKRLMGTFPQTKTEPRLVHIATDGETYGHHQHNGDMALAYCMHQIQKNHLAKVTIYGEYLEKFPPVDEVRIVEDSSWSCAHGVKRWKADCGCCTGLHPGWDQKWREPLRNALDEVREALIPLYEREGSALLKDPWAARDAYIDVILDRSPKNVEKFFQEHARGELLSGDQVRILKLMEMQRHAMLMYTSCGWFFDDISGIETIQIIQYAARAMQLCQQLTGVELEENFVRMLEKAPSNVSEIKNGSVVYERFVRPAVTDLLRVGAHYAVSSLFQEYPQKTSIYCYEADSEAFDQQKAGKHALVTGKIRIKSHITWEEDTVNFAALHLGNHNLNCGVHAHRGDEAFAAMEDGLKAAFSKGDVAEVIGLMNRHFGPNNYSFWHLFKHEQQRIFDEIMKSTLQDIEDHYRHIYEEHYTLMQARKDMRIPLPKALSTTIEFVLNRELLNLLENRTTDVRRLKKVVDEVRRWSLEVDRATLGFVASKRIDALMQDLLKRPEDLDLLRTIQALMRLLNSMTVSFDLWKAQNVYFQLSKRYENGQDSSAGQENEKWIKHFRELGRTLLIKNE